MILSFRKTLLLYTLLPISVVFLIFSLENIRSTKEQTHIRIENHLGDLAQGYVHIIDSYLSQVAMQANIAENLITAFPDLSEQDIYEFLKMNVEQDPKIYGMAIAYVPYQFDGKRKLFSPYVYRQDDKIKQMDISQSGYDYTEPQWEWWHKPLSTGKGGWTEPYFDQGAGNILMSTYSVPFFNEDGDIRGVVTIDIPLHQVNSNIKVLGMKKYKIFMLSAKGKVLLSPKENDIGDTYSEVISRNYSNAVDLIGEKNARSIRDTQSSLVKDMLSGKEGKKITNLEGKLENRNVWYFFAPIGSTGWSVAIGLNESEAFAHVYSRVWYAIIFFSMLILVLVILIMFASGKFSKSFEWIINRCMRIERMNFQVAKQEDIKITEIKHLSNTLDGMCRALSSHYSNAESSRVEDSVRLQSLPANLPEIPGYQIKIWNRPTENGCGEVYDVLDLPAMGKVSFLLLRDSDKDIEATVKSAQLRAIFRTTNKQGSSPADIADQMNEFLFSDSPSNGPVQAWLGSLNKKTGGVVNLSLGQNTVFHFSSKQNEVIRYSDNTMALALQKTIPGKHEQVLELLPEDLLVVTSEGITSALNQSREAFGAERVQNLVKVQGKNNANVSLDALKETFLAFTRDAYIQTDCSIIIIKRLSQD